MSIEPFSLTWMTIDEWARGEIEDARDNLEEYDDEALRGRIAALRELLALGDSEQKEEITSVDYSN